MNQVSEIVNKMWTTQPLEAQNLTTLTNSSPTLLPRRTVTNSVLIPDVLNIHGPYFPANINLTPTATSTADLTFTIDGTPSSEWFEQNWIPLAIYLLFAYSLASAILMLWMWLRRHVSETARHPNTLISLQCCVRCSWSP